MELAGRKDPVAKFSGGMKRRLNLAIGILHAPQILLLDEPTVGIDVHARARILEIIRERARTGTGFRRVAALGNVNQNLSWTIALPDPPPQAIFWSVQAIDASFAGSAFAEEQILGDPTGVIAIEALPTTYALHAVAPNPFGASTTIRFDLPRAGQARLEIFNVMGRRVRVLENGEMNPGRYAPVWDGRDEAGRSVSPGVYFVRMQAGDFSATEKVVRTR